MIYLIFVLSLYLAKLHQIDMQHAIILEEKIRTQLDLLKENRSSSKNTQIIAEDFFTKMTSYKELLGDNVDSTKILENVLMSIHVIIQSTYYFPIFTLFTFTIIGHKSTCIFFIYCGNRTSRF